jgi:hypothetical protein
MKPAQFPEANTTFGPPEGFAESQVYSIPAYMGTSEGGSCDGVDIVVVKYELSSEELRYMAQRAEEGEPPAIYITMMGGLAPHYLSLSFHQATHPA